MPDYEALRETESIPELVEAARLQGEATIFLLAYWSAASVLRSGEHTHVGSFPSVVGQQLEVVREAAENAVFPASSELLVFAPRLVTDPAEFEWLRWNGREYQPLSCCLNFLLTRDPWMAALAVADAERWLPEDLLFALLQEKLASLAPSPPTD